MIAAATGIETFGVGLLEQAPVAAAIIVVVVIFMRYIAARDNSSEKRDLELIATIRHTAERYDAVITRNTETLVEVRDAMRELRRAVNRSRSDAPSAGG